MSAEILITICIPTYNNESTICKAIDSCINQSISYGYEILIVNNASTDFTKKKLNKYLAHANVRIITNSKTVSLYENHNICLHNARGKYVLFCHSDDELDYDAISILTSHLRKRDYPNRYICWGHSLFRDYSNLLNNFGILTGQLFAGERAIAPFLIGGLTPSGTCYSRDFVNYHGFINTSHRLASSDSSTMIYLALNGFRFEMIQQIIFKRTHASTAIPKTPNKDKYYAYCEAYDKLRLRISSTDLERIFNFTKTLNKIPYRFYYFYSQYDSKAVLNQLLKHLIKDPKIIIKNRYMHILIKTLQYYLYK